MDIVLKLNDQLKEIENELEKAIQSRQSELAIAPQIVIPTFSIAIPSTLAASLEPTLPPVTTLLVVETIPTIGTLISAGKTIEKISIQATKAKKSQGTNVKFGNKL